MARRGKPSKKQASKKNNSNEDGAPSNIEEPAFSDHEVEARSSAIRALRDMQIEELLTNIRLLRSYLSKEQLEIPVKQFFQENVQSLCIAETGNNGLYEVKWKDNDVNLHGSLLHRLSVAYPGGFDYSNQSVKTTILGADKLNIRSLVFDEPSDSQILEPKDGLRTPNVNNNNRLSFGMTPKTLRHPRYGEMLLSVHGSPLGVYKEDNMETIKETEDC